jgi:hypothetical protein
MGEGGGGRHSGWSHTCRISPDAAPACRTARAVTRAPRRPGAPLPPSGAGPPPLGAGRTGWSSGCAQRRRQPGFSQRSGQRPLPSSRTSNAGGCACAPPHSCGPSCVRHPFASTTPHGRRRRRRRGPSQRHGSARSHGAPQLRPKIARRCWGAGAGVGAGAVRRAGKDMCSRSQMCTSASCKCCFEAHVWLHPSGANTHGCRHLPSPAPRPPARPRAERRSLSAEPTGGAAAAGRGWRRPALAIAEVLVGHGRLARAVLRAVRRRASERAAVRARADVRRDRLVSAGSISTG